MPRQTESTETRCCDRVPKPQRVRGARCCCSENGTWFARHEYSQAYAGRGRANHNHSLEEPSDGSGVKFLRSENRWKHEQRNHRELARRVVAIGREQRPTGRHPSCQQAERDETGRPHQSVQRQARSSAETKKIAPGQQEIERKCSVLRSRKSQGVEERRVQVCSHEANA